MTSEAGGGASPVRRLPALVLIVVVVALAGLVDHAVGRPRAAGSVVSAGMPVSPPAGALSSTWYCVGGSAGGGSPADTSFVVANAGRTPRTGSITIVSSQGGTDRGPLNVPPAGRAVGRAPGLAEGPREALP